MFGSLVKRLRRRPLTAETGVRFPYELLNFNYISFYGSLVKRLRRRPLTAETGVRFPYELLTVIINSPTRKLKAFAFSFFMTWEIASQSCSARQKCAFFTIFYNPKVCEAHFRSFTKSFVFYKASYSYINRIVSLMRPASGGESHKPPFLLYAIQLRSTMRTISANPITMEILLVSTG